MSRRRFHGKSWYLSLIAAASALVLTVGALAGSASGAGSASPRCATSNLRLDFVPPVEAATGHRLWNLTLRNVGPTTCHLKGFPGIGLLDSHARPINNTVIRVTGFAQHTVVLHPWQRAWFSFLYGVGAFCPGHSLSPYGIAVIPPNNSSGLRYYSGRVDLCSHPSVYPVRPSKSPL